MKNTDKDHTVRKWGLIVRPKIPHMPQKFSAQFVCQSPKVWNSRKKTLWVSVVREAALPSSEKFMLSFGQQLC